MSKRFLSNLAFAIALSVLLTLVYPMKSTASAAPVEGNAPVEILPQMELLAGVLTQTSWITHRGPQGKGNKYFQALKEFMEPYKDHEAVRIAQELTDKGFTFDAPPAFACHLGPLPELELAAEYSEYLVRRAGGRDVLERFRIAMKDLAEESKFTEFLAGWQDTFARWIEQSSAGFDRPKIEKWLTEFFGWEASGFHVVLAPAMFPGGGYGATVVDRDGRSIGYNIVRCGGTSEGDPDLPSGISVETLTLHELGHYFVNPSLDEHPSLVQRLQPWYLKVERQMKDMAYGQLGTYANEQVLRAVCAVARRDLYGEQSYEQAIEREERYGFHLTRVAAEALSDYAQNRDQYPKFTDFVPELLDRMTSGDPPGDLAEEITRQVWGWLAFAWGMVGLKWLVVIVLLALILLRMKRIRKDAEGPKAV